MSFIDIQDITGFSIAIAAFICLLRFKKILKTYRPFAYFAWLALFTEVLSSYLLRNGHGNAIVGNIYVLIEFFLITWLFKNWGFNQRRNEFYVIITLIIIFVWVLDSLILHSISQFSSIYRIAYSLVLVFLSVDQVNHIIVSEKKNIFTNARFVICVAFIIFFCFKGLDETFILAHLKLGRTFYRYLYLITNIFDLFANLLYALAALWIPSKQRFSLAYS